MSITNKFVLCILSKLSRGEVSLMEATAILDYQDAGYTLHALAKAGLQPFVLDEKTIKMQADLALDALRSTLRTRQK